MTRLDPLEGLAHSNEFLRFWLSEYYDILNADEAFSQALTELFRRFRRSEIPRRPPLNECERRLERKRRRTKAKRFSCNQPSPKMAEAFKSFATTWKLPERTWKWPLSHETPDLYYSYGRWRAVTSRPPQLLVAPQVGDVAVRSVTITLGPVNVLYDPVFQSPTAIRNEIAAQLREMKNRAHAQIKEVQEAVRAAGWKEISKRQRNPDERRLLLERLYKRAVLNLTWAELAKDQSRDPRSVMDSVQNLANLLGVPVKRPAGRPRKL